MKALFLSSSILLCLLCFLLFSFILTFGKRTALNRLWALFNLSVSIWALGIYFASNSSTGDLALFYWKFAHFGGLFIAVFFYHTTTIFCNIKSVRRKFFLILIYFQVIFFLVLNFTGHLVTNTFLLFGSFHYNSANLLYSLALVNWLTLVLLGHSDLFRFYRIAALINRNKVKYLFFGFLTGFLGGFTYFVPMYHIKIFPIGNFTIALYCLIATYAILKYRLMDVNVAFTRVGIFIAVYSFVLGIPLAVAFLWGDMLLNILGVSWWIAPLVLLTILATAGPFLYLYIDQKAQNALLREQRNYQNVLRNASSGMIRIKNLDRLLNVIAHVVTKAVRIKHTSIFLLHKDNENYILKAERGIKNAQLGISAIDFGSPLIWTIMKSKEPIVSDEVILRLSEEPQNLALESLVRQLSALKGSLVVPSFVEQRLIGFLVLGEKRSGKMYSQDDIVVFSVLANQAALAIENAQFYDEIKQTHEQLFQAEKLATIGTMADGLSHQINNRFHALSLIAGDSLDMLKTFDSSACNDAAKQVLTDLRGALERIESNVLQGGEVVKGLLKYSRPGDTGHEAVDFKEVVSGAIDMVQYKIKLKEIDLIQEIPHDIPRIHANLIQLQEVFFNLIDNAYDAIKERQTTLKEEGYRGKIQIQARSNDGVLDVIVSDNGMGIKDLDRKKLFTPFFTTKATARKGTGLGLYVIEKIISSHNGKIQIDSIYQTGTNFKIELPMFKSKTV